jgi:predicted DNA binding CopG/RHH family protein
LGTATAEYNNAYNNMINTYTTDDPINNTLKQRIEDSSVLDDHFKSMAILWGVISVSIVAIIIFRPNN